MPDTLALPPLEEVLGAKEFRDAPKERQDYIIGQWDAQTSSRLAESRDTTPQQWFGHRHGMLMLKAQRDGVDLQNPDEYDTVDTGITQHLQGELAKPLPDRLQGKATLDDGEFENQIKGLDDPVEASRARALRGMTKQQVAGGFVGELAKATGNLSQVMSRELQGGVMQRTQDLLDAGTGGGAGRRVTRKWEDVGLRDVGGRTYFSILDKAKERPDGYLPEEAAASNRYVDVTELADKIRAAGGDPSQIAEEVKLRTVWGNPDDKGNRLRYSPLTGEVLANPAAAKYLFDPKVAEEEIAALPKQYQADARKQLPEIQDRYAKALTGQIATGEALADKPGEVGTLGLSKLADTAAIKMGVINDLRAFQAANQDKGWNDAEMLRQYYAKVGDRSWLGKALDKLHTGITSGLTEAALTVPEISGAALTMEGMAVPQLGRMGGKVLQWTEEQKQALGASTAATGGETVAGLANVGAQAAAMILTGGEAAAAKMEAELSGKIVAGVVVKQAEAAAVRTAAEEAAVTGAEMTGDAARVLLKETAERVAYKDFIVKATSDKSAGAVMQAAQEAAAKAAQNVGQGVLYAQMAVPTYSSSYTARMAQFQDAIKQGTMTEEQAMRSAAGNAFIDAGMTAAIVYLASKATGGAAAKTTSRLAGGHLTSESTLRSLVSDAGGIGKLVESVRADKTVLPKMLGILGVNAGRPAAEMAAISLGQGLESAYRYNPDMTLKQLSDSVLSASLMFAAMGALHGMFGAGRSALPDALVPHEMRGLLDHITARDADLTPAQRRQFRIATDGREKAMAAMDAATDMDGKQAALQDIKRADVALRRLAPGWKPETAEQRAEHDAAQAIAPAATAVADEIGLPVVPETGTGVYDIGGGKLVNSRGEEVNADGSLKEPPAPAAEPVPQEEAAVPHGTPDVPQDEPRAAVPAKETTTNEQAGKQDTAAATKEPEQAAEAGGAEAAAAERAAAARGGEAAAEAVTEPVAPEPAAAAPETKATRKRAADAARAAERQRVAEIEDRAAVAAVQRREAKQQPAAESVRDKVIAALENNDAQAAIALLDKRSKDELAKDLDGIVPTGNAKTAKELRGRFSSVAENLTAKARKERQLQRDVQSAEKRLTDALDRQRRHAEGRLGYPTGEASASVPELPDEWRDPHGVGRETGLKKWQAEVDAARSKLAQAQQAAGIAPATEPDPAPATVKEFQQILPGMGKFSKRLSGMRAAITDRIAEIEAENENLPYDKQKDTGRLERLLDKVEAQVSESMKKPAAEPAAAPTPERAAEAAAKPKLSDEFKQTLKETKIKEVPNAEGRDADGKPIDTEAKAKNEATRMMAEGKWEGDYDSLVRYLLCIGSKT